MICTEFRIAVNQWKKLIAVMKKFTQKRTKKNVSSTFTSPNKHTIRNIPISGKCNASRTTSESEGRKRRNDKIIHYINNSVLKESYLELEERELVPVKLPYFIRQSI